jgi:hypothetical protein
VLGFVALGMAGAYLTMGTFTRRRIPGDAKALFGFIALAVAFLTLAVPLHLRMHGITLAWAVEGPVLLYLGYRYGYLVPRALGLVVLAAAAVHLFWAHWPLHEMAFVPVFNANFTSALFVPLAGAAYALVHHWKRAGSTGADRGLKTGAVIASGFLALVVVHAETALGLEYSGLSSADARYLTRSSAAFIWAAGAAGFLVAGTRARSLPSRVSGLVALFVAGVLAAMAYAVSFDGGVLLFLNARFGASLAAVAVAFAYGAAAGRLADASSRDERNVCRFLGWAGVFLLFLLLSVEVHGYFREAIASHERSRWVAQMALSITWGLYATALLAVGFWRRNRALRLAGLGLFGVTALKLVLVDMAAVKQVFRIVAFLVLGLLMVGESYLYHRVEKMLEEPPDERPAQ